MDWALEPSGRVSLLEVNAAPGMRGYRSMPTLTPALWKTMIELVALAQTATPTWLQTRARRGFQFFGWHLIYNEIHDRGTSYTCEDIRQSGSAGPV